MTHPFINNLSEKSLEELQNTISELTGKLNYAHRSQNINLVRQLTMAIDSYREEYNRKMDELIKKQNIHTKINIEKDK